MPPNYFNENDIPPLTLFRLSKCYYLWEKLSYIIIATRERGVLTTFLGAHTASLETFTYYVHYRLECNHKH